MQEKIIRDPVHDVIVFRLDRPTDALLFKLLNSKELQRLRRIRQLGMASLAYPGADHSRYSHSLGVMETARKIIGRLGEFIPVDPERQTVCLVAALLHDVGHGPFSHVFERVSGIDHEELTLRAITDPAGDIHRYLIEHDAQLPAKVASFLQCDPKRSFYNDVISSQLDADRFDYLLRDNLMTGSRYGGFDLRWLLQALTVDAYTDRLAVTLKGASAVEAYMQARYHMYRNVYFHKVVRAAEGMLRLALQRAKRLAIQDRLAWPTPDSAVQKALLGRSLTIEDFTDLDDISITHCFKVWSKSDDTILAGLCNGVLYRRIFKTIDLTHRADEESALKLFEKAQQAVTLSGGESAYELFYDQPLDTPYEIFGEDDCGKGSQILVQLPDGRLTEFASVSPQMQALNRQLMFRRIHVSDAYRDVVAGELGIS